MLPRPHARSNNPPAGHTDRHTFHTDTRPPAHTPPPQSERSHTLYIESLHILHNTLLYIKAHPCPQLPQLPKATHAAHAAHAAHAGSLDRRGNTVLLYWTVHRRYERRSCCTAMRCNACACAEPLLRNTGSCSRRCKAGGDSLAINHGSISGFWCG